MRTAIIILAAGSSRRMGRPKQLLPWGDTTLIEHAIHEALATTSNVLVVLGAHSAIIQDQIAKLEVETCFNPDYRLGLGVSIACGVSALTSRNQRYTSIFIMLVDQPQVDARFLEVMLELHSVYPEKVIATAYPDRPGVPALFPEHYYPDLLALNGDSGAGQWMKRHPDLIELFHPPTPLYDLDTPADYQRHEGDQERH